MRTDHAHQLSEKAAHGELAGKAELLGLLASVSQEFVASPVMGETLANATQKILHRYLTYFLLKCDPAESCSPVRLH